MRSGLALTSKQFVSGPQRRQQLILATAAPVASGTANSAFSGGSAVYDAVIIGAGISGLSTAQVRNCPLTQASSVLLLLCIQRR